MRNFGRWLPARARRDMFEPAANDLQLARIQPGLRYNLKLFAIFLECWRLVLTETLSFDSRPSLPPKERLAMFLNDLRHAFRLLRREPAFTLAAILTLALGVGANIAVFAVIEAVLLRPLPYADADRLVTVQHRDRRTGITKQFVAMGDYVDLVKRQGSFESMGGYGGGLFTVTDSAEPFRVTALMAAPGLLDTLRIRPSLGRLLQTEDSRPGAARVVMLSYELWRSQYGSDPHIVGRGIQMNQIVRQVVGVGPQGFHFPPTGRTDVIVPMTVPLQAMAERKSGWTFAVARRKPGVSLEAATANLNLVSRQLEKEYPRSNLASEYFAISLRDTLVGNTKPALLLMLAAVSILLLIACANVANLLLARSLSRRREMAVRVALGAGRGRLISQMLSESLVLAVAAGAIGLVFAQWGSQALVGLVPKSVSVPGLADVRINPGVLAFALGITIATALVFGVLTALTVRMDNATGALVAPSRVSMGAKARRAASALVVVEVSFAIVLLIGAGLILRTFSKLLSVDPGFRTDHVMTMEIMLPPARYREVQSRTAFYNRAFAALKALPNVRDAGSATIVPLTGNNWTVPFERPEHPVPAGQRPPEVGIQVATSGYFSALKIPLRKGRMFDERDTPDGHPVVIVSEAIERRFFPEGSAVGRELKQGDQKLEIVGVVGNIRRAGLQDEPREDLYFAADSQPPSITTIFVRTASDPLSEVPLMQSVLKSIEPGLIFNETRSMSEILNQSVQVTQLALWLLGVFAITAIVLASVGIYGVMSYLVRQRTREIGTRVALGATAGDILWLVMRQGAVIALLGAAIGTSAGWAAARSLKSLLYSVTPADPLTFAIAPAVLAAATMAACYLPARRAARIDPARTLTDQ